jgi:O-antigen ligase
LWLERGIVLVVAALLVFGPLALGGIGVLPFAVMQCLGILAMVLWCIRLWVGAESRLLWTPLCWAVLAFAGYAVVRYFSADIEYVARGELSKVLLYAGMFLVIHGNVYRQEHARAIALTLVFLAMGVSAYALYQYFTGDHRVWMFVSPYGNRATGTYISPNNLGGFLEMVLPLGLAYTLVGRFRPLTRIFIGYASLVIMAGVAVTFSRGAWLATVLSLAFLIVVLLLRRHHRLPAMALLLCLVVSGAVLIPRELAFKARLQETVGKQGKKIESNLRFDMWGAALRLWQENRLLGAGPAHFDYRFRAFRPESVQRRPDRVHNDFLNTLVDWGVAGFTLVLSAWGIAAWSAWRSWRYTSAKLSDLGGQTTSSRAAFVLGGAAALLAIFLHSGLDFNMHVPANALLAVSLMALVSSHLRFTTKAFWVRNNLAVRGVLSIGLAGISTFLALQVARQLPERTWLNLADAAPDFSTQQIDFLQRALECEPANFQTAYQIGEAYRIQSLEGGDNYRELGQEALRWYERSYTLNRWDGYAYLRYGMCLDWLDRSPEAEAYFWRAESLDPNGYFMVAHIGIHYAQLRNWAAAREWFERSLHLEWDDNQIARNYLQICDARLREDSQLTVPRTRKTAAP